MGQDVHMGWSVGASRDERPFGAYLEARLAFDAAGTDLHLPAFHGYDTEGADLFAQPAAFAFIQVGFHINSLELYTLCGLSGRRRGVFADLSLHHTVYYHHSDARYVADFDGSLRILAGGTHGRIDDLQITVETGCQDTLG